MLQTQLCEYYQIKLGPNILELITSMMIAQMLGRVSPILARLYQLVWYVCTHTYTIVFQLVLSSTSNAMSEASSQARTYKIVLPDC